MRQELYHDLQSEDKNEVPSARNRPSSDTVYQGTVVIPYVKGISEKFRRIGYHFSLRTVFKPKHTLRRTLMKAGPVRNAQETKQSVCTASHVIVADVAVWKYASRSTNITGHRICFKSQS
jgi:hypothetical protein